MSDPAGESVDPLVRQLVARLTAEQYADGARFVRAVVDRAGRDGFNVVWQAPQNLPTRAEIADPSAWCDRVL